MGTLRRGLALATIAVATGLALLAGQHPMAVERNTWNPNGHSRCRRPTREPNKKKCREENRKSNKAARKARKRNR